MRLFGFEISRAGEKRASLENPRYSLDDPSLLSAVGLFSHGSGLPTVTPQRAVQTSAVYACVRVLAESIASLPLHVYEKGADDSVSKAENINEYLLLHNQPNSYQTSYGWREQAMFQAALWGKSICEIERDGDGRVIGFYPIPAWEARAELVEKGSSLMKVWHVRGQRVADENMLHIPAPGWDGLDGISPIALHRASLAMTLGAEEFGANFYQNGARLSGILEHPGKISKEAADRLRHSWEQNYSGSGNSGKTALLEEGMKYAPVTMPLADAQFIETRKFQVSDIARIFRIPPHKVGDLQHATFSNIEQQSIEFVQDTLLPWVTRWEQELNRKMFGHVPGLQNRYFVRFNLAGLLRGDMVSRFRAYAVGRQWGWLSVNDVRELENLSPIENGDEYLTPMNMIPAGHDPLADDTKDDTKKETK